MIWKPSNLEQLIGNEKTKLLYETFLLDWTHDKQVCLIHGKVCSGKSSLVGLFKDLYNYLYFFLSSDQDPCKALKEITGTKTITEFFRPSPKKIIVIEDIDLLIDHIPGFCDELEASIKNKSGNIKYVVTIGSGNIEHKKWHDAFISRNKPVIISMENPAFHETVPLLIHISSVLNNTIEIPSDKELKDLYDKYDGQFYYILKALHENEFSGDDVETESMNSSSCDEKEIYIDPKTCQLVNEKVKWLLTRTSSVTCQDLDIIASFEPTALTNTLFHNAVPFIISSRIKRWEGEVQKHISAIKDLFLSGCILEQESVLLNNWTLFEISYLVRIMGIQYSVNQALHREIPTSPSSSFIIKNNNVYSRIIQHHVNWKKMLQTIHDYNMSYEHIAAFTETSHVNKLLKNSNTDFFAYIYTTYICNQKMSERIFRRPIKLVLKSTSEK